MLDLPNMRMRLRQNVYLVNEMLLQAWSWLVDGNV